MDKKQLNVKDILINKDVYKRQISAIRAWNSSLAASRRGEAVISI